MTTTTPEKWLVVCVKDARGYTRGSPMNGRERTREDAAAKAAAMSDVYPGCFVAMSDDDFYASIDDDSVLDRYAPTPQMDIGDKSRSELPDFDIFDVEANRKNILPIGKAIIADDGECKLIAYIGAVKIPKSGKPIYTIYRYPLFGGLHNEMPNPLRTTGNIIRSTNPKSRILGYHLAPDNMDKSPQTAAVEMELCRKIHRLWLRAIGTRKTVF